MLIETVTGIVVADATIMTAVTVITVVIEVRGEELPAVAVVRLNRTPTKQTVVKPRQIANALTGKPVGYRQCERDEKIVIEKGTEIGNATASVTGTVTGSANGSAIGTGNEALVPSATMTVNAETGRKSVKGSTALVVIHGAIGMSSITVLTLEAPSAMTVDAGAIATRKALRAAPLNAIVVTVVNESAVEVSSAIRTVANAPQPQRKQRRRKRPSILVAKKGRLKKKIRYHISWTCS
jgi:hypothetical protein